MYGYTATQESFATSTTQALYVLGLISLSLAIINLFPFLPLDGGHVFWAVAEKVRGKRIPFEVMERAGVVGFVLILLVFVIGFTNDISTLSGPARAPLTAPPVASSPRPLIPLRREQHEPEGGGAGAWRAARSRRRWGERLTPRR